MCLESPESKIERETLEQVWYVMDSPLAAFRYVRESSRCGRKKESVFSESGRDRNGKGRWRTPTPRVFGWVSGRLRRGWGRGPGAKGGGGGVI